jgi:flagellar hook-basal body protein
LPPARQIAETVYDSLGNPRQVTVLFYQLNDLGTAQPPINPPPGPSQVCYAWYAFDTTGGQKVATSNLVGGTGIIEGDMQPPFGQFYYDRGQNGDLFMGDFVWFNTDGSLASSGGSGGPVPAPPGVPNFMTIPRVYLPPINQNPAISPIPSMGAEITAVDLNFGSFGVLETGKRDGLFSDAAGSYQVVNGVSTYVPDQTAYAASQNGYPEGTLQGLNVDSTGTIQGSFSNGQKVNLAQVALAQVDNPDGLLRAGNNNFAPSGNTGSTRIGVGGQSGFGMIQSSGLEGSNVDLTVELSNMIVAQRGFDANARTISDVTQSLDTLTNLGR